MSNAAPGSEGNQPAPAEQPAEPKVNFEDRLAQLEATNKRLLDESKTYKTKYQSLKDEADKKENEILTAKEDYKKLLEKEREKSQQLEGKLTKVKSKTLHKSLDIEVSRYAPDAHDLELVKQSLPRDVIDAVEQDDDYSVTGVKEAIEKLKTEKPFLFKAKSIPGMANGKPAAAQPAQQAGPKALKDMSPAQLANLLVSKQT